MSARVRAVAVLLALLAAACGPKVGHITADPRVDETLYELQAVRVGDASELARVRELFAKKYGDDDAESWGFWARDPAWVFRLEDR